MQNHWKIKNEAKPDELASTIVCPTDGAEMVLVPAGEFLMGISEEELLAIYQRENKQSFVFATEMPALDIHLDSYYIDRYPVTNYQYRKFIEETGHREPLLINHPLWGEPLQPVVFVGWEDARAYARWAGKSLPTEAQWEKAGRGLDGRHYSWGREFEQNRCNSREYGLERTSPIGTFDLGTSPYGCYDMCGNVWEMCEGRWLEQHQPMRGGCFLGSSAFVRVTCRWTPEDPVNGAHWLGFRCVKNIDS
jgi:iron(II)-dependent oxidoreductase